MNPYYDPVYHGLEVVCVINFPQDDWGFDVLAVWRSFDTGDLYYGEDAGCSCPAPFEGFQVADLVRVQSAEEIESRIERRFEESSSYGRLSAVECLNLALEAKFRLRNAVAN